MQMDPPKVIPKPPRYNPSQKNPVFEHSSLHFRSFFQSTNPNTEGISLPPDAKPEANDEPEISIFEARKYFNNNKNKNNSNNNIVVNSGDFIKMQQNRPSSVSSDGYGRKFRTSSFHATPTASSEASWNSQTGLLVNPPGYMADSVKSLASYGGNNNHRRRNSGKKWVFRRKCCCTGEKSIRIKEATAAGDSGPGPTRSKNSTPVKIPPAEPISGRLLLPEGNFVAAEQPRQQRISASGRPFADGFAFPILKGSTQTVRPGPMGIRRLGEDPPRDSLDVFQPADSDPSAGGGGRRNFNLGSPIARMASTDDDVGSDASSDLFELESFATQTLDEAPIFISRRYAGRTSLDEPPTPSVAATECYAPSEVSVTWSVSTAEGFDRASVSNFSVSASEAGGAEFLRRGRKEEVCAENGGMRKGNRAGLLLMSCRQGKAVSVGPHPVKFLPEGPGGAPSKPPPGCKTTVLAFGA